jgi:hypothetical protein
MIERLLDHLPAGASAPVTIRVTVSAPVLRADGYFESTLSIEGLGKPYRAPFQQVDSLGALVAAASMAPIILYSRIGKGDRLTWLDGEDLGFPLLTPPKHYWTFHPSSGGESQQISITIAPPQESGGGWSCLVTLMTDEGCDEHWICAETWALALERAAAAVPSVLNDVIEKLGGGSVEDSPSPA